MEQEVWERIFAGISPETILQKIQSILF